MKYKVGQKLPLEIHYVNSDKVDIKDVPPGVYFLKIMNDIGQKAVFRIVKQ